MTMGEREELVLEEDFCLELVTEEELVSLGLLHSSFPH